MSASLGLKLHRLFIKKFCVESLRNNSLLYPNLIDFTCHARFKTSFASKFSTSYRSELTNFFPNAWIQGAAGLYHTTASLHLTKQTRKTYVQNNIASKLFTKRQKAEDATKTFFQSISPESIVNRTPESIKPYLQLMRVDKPIGTWLLYFPCVFSICLATPPGEFPSLYYLGLFGTGAFLMRGAGCIINDLWDKDLDKQVERTKTRPIAAGKVSVNNAIKLLAGNLTISLGILLSLNYTCIAMGVVSMIPVLLYPLAKRYTFFPQVALGFTFNAGALMGYTAVTGQLNLPVIISLYASCIFWTIYYDTIYAFQDADDDRLAGIKSTALLFDKYSPEELSEMPLSERLNEERNRKTKVLTFLMAMSSAQFLLFTAAGILNELNGMFYLGVGIAVASVFEQLMSFDPNNRLSCGEVFNKNRLLGLVLALGIIIAVQSKRKQSNTEKV